MEEWNLNVLKHEYKKLQEKYGLPVFEKLNEDFSIEKLAKNETEFLLKEIRRIIAEKYSNYFAFMEAILNPVNMQMFIFSIVKSLKAEEKSKLTEIYKLLSRNELELIETDVKSSEENEAEYIRKSYELWKEIKKDLLEIIEEIKKNWDNKSPVNNKHYFG